MRTRTAYREKYRVVFEQPTGELETKTIRVPLWDSMKARMQHESAKDVVERLFPDAVVKRVEFLSLTKS